MLGDETDFYCADKSTGPWYFNSTSFGTKGLELSASLVDLHERALAGDAAHGVSPMGVFVRTAAASPAWHWDRPWVP